MLRFVVIAAAIFSLALASAQADTPTSLQGRVIDTSGIPVAAATVTVISSGKKLSTVASDPSGGFVVSLPDSVYFNLTIRATSVGYEPATVSLSVVRGHQTVELICRPAVVETERVEVVAQRPIPPGVIRLDRKVISAAAMKSLIPSDPLAVVRYPQMAHVGFNFASQLRIDGSIPRYYLNGLSIGADPTHFGAFGFVPTPAVDQITFSPQGTNAQYPSPTVVELKTSDRFETLRRGEITASVIDLTGSYLYSQPTFFAGGTLRRSLINEISSRVNLGSSRHEIPAPKLTDLLMSFGLKPTEHLRFLSDVYHIEDNLTYTLGQKTGAEGEVISEQRGVEDHASVRSIVESGRWSGSLGLGFRTGHRNFKVYPASSQASSLTVTFEEKYQYYQISGDLGYRTGPFELRAGTQYEAMSSLDLHLRQYHWNLLSPFAHSDNLNLFQSSIDEFYDAVDGSLFGWTNGLHAGGTIRSGRFQFESGLRLETFSYLSEKNRLAGRFGAQVSIGTRSSLNLFYGTFFESPVTTAMENYQVPVRMYASTLEPVETRLATASYKFGVLTFEVFDKEILRQPVLTPDYDHVGFRDSLGFYVADPRFLIPHSTGQSTFQGASLTFDSPEFLSDRISLYVSYAYSRARTTINGIVLHHDLDAPHRLEIQTGYALSRHLQCSSELTIHSGYPFTPAHLVVPYDPFVPPPTTEYKRDLILQNSDRFSPNLSLNLHISYVFSRGNIFFSIINATNYGNEMIRSSDQFIYDAGLLPNVGFTYRF